jgi:hypothetical protein
VIQLTSDKVKPVHLSYPIQKNYHRNKIDAYINTEDELAMQETDELSLDQKHHLVK